MDSLSIRIAPVLPLLFPLKSVAPVKHRQVWSLASALFTPRYWWRHGGQTCSHPTGDRGADHFTGDLGADHSSGVLGGGGGGDSRRRSQRRPPTPLAVRRSLAGGVSVLIRRRAAADGHSRAPGLPRPDLTWPDLSAAAWAATWPREHAKGENMHRHVGGETSSWELRQGHIDVGLKFHHTCSSDALPCFSTHAYVTCPSKVFAWCNVKCFTRHRSDSHFNVLCMVLENPPTYTYKCFYFNQLKLECAS